MNHNQQHTKTLNPNPTNNAIPSRPVTSHETYPTIDSITKDRAINIKAEHLEDRAEQEGCACQDIPSSQAISFIGQLCMRSWS